MQAIILAAGMGRRLGEFTKNNTKCMVPVNGVKLIDRMLTQLAALHLQRVVIVVGYEGQRLRNYIGNRYDDVLRIEYVNNPVYDKTNNIYSLALAKEQLQEDDTLLIESDLIFDDSMFPLILDDPRPNLALVAKYETWMDGTMVCIDDDCNIVNFVPKKAFSYAETYRYYKTVNIYKFSREFSRHKYVPFLEAYTKAVGNNEYYEQVLRVITLLDKTDLKALPITTEKWYEIDDVQDLDIASALFADQPAERKSSICAVTEVIGVFPVCSISATWSIPISPQNACATKCVPTSTCCSPNTPRACMSTACWPASASMCSNTTWLWATVPPNSLKV